MRHLIQARRAGFLTVAAAGGVLLVAGPAAADVTVSPPTAAQGSGENLTFHVTNPAKAAMTRVKLVLPADTPVAEVYPLSTDDWAPQITQQKLSTPLAAIHGGTPVTETAKDITWIAMPGKAVAPGRSADLSVAIGPLPSLSRMRFTVVPAYADGTVGPAMPPAVLKLTPAAPGQAPAQHPGHAGTTGTTGTGATDPEAAYFEQVVADQGPSVWSIAGWIVAGLAVAGGTVAFLRSRRKAAPAAETDPDAEPGPDEATEEPVAAGAARITSWSYRDGPAG